MSEPSFASSFTSVTGEDSGLYSTKHFLHIEYAGNELRLLYMFGLLSLSLRVLMFGRICFVEASTRFFEL